MVRIRIKTRITGGSCPEVSQAGEEEERGEVDRVLEVEELADKEGLMILEMRRLESGEMMRWKEKVVEEGKYHLECKEEEGGMELGLAVEEERRGKSGRQPVRQAWRRGRREIKLE